MRSPTQVTQDVFEWSPAGSKDVAAIVQHHVLGVILQKDQIATCVIRAVVIHVVDDGSWW
jgi:hypothetical protein